MTVSPTSFQSNACCAGQMLLQTNGAAGQQLFICNTALDDCMMVNDDTTTASAANADAEGIKTILVHHVNLGNTALMNGRCTVDNSLVLSLGQISGEQI